MNKKINTIKVFQLLIRELHKKEKKKLLLSGSLSLFLGLTEGIGLMLIVPMLSVIGIINSTTNNPIANTIQKFYNAIGVQISLFSILTSYLLIISIYSLIKYLRTISDTDVVENFTHKLRSSIFNSFSYADWIFFTQKNTADLTTPLFTHVNQIGSAINNLLQLFTNGIISLIYLSTALYIAPSITFIALGSIFLLSLTHKQINKKSLSFGYSNKGLHRKFHQVVLEYVEGIKTAKSYGAEEMQNNHFSSVSDELGDNIKRTNKTSARGEIILAIGGAFIISTFYYIAIEYMNIRSENLLLLTVIFARLIPKTTTILKLYQRFINQIPAFETCINLRDEAHSCREDYGVNKNAPLLQECIEFKNISFFYPSGKPVLANINFKIFTGSITAILGKSGKGKTTLIDLLLMLLKPQQGTIQIDNQSLADVNLKQWRETIGYVPQDAFLLNESIRTNLLWANSNASEEEMISALKNAAALDFINQLPDKLGTPIGTKGVRLSGGQRQRISIAMALVRKPSLLILDEATNAVDEDNEQLIFSHLKTIKNLTVILISHRQSTLAHANYFVDLENLAVN